MPVIRADLGLEETYSPPSSVAAFPIVAMSGKRPGRDQQKSFVSAEAAGLWGRATSAPFRHVAVDTDWYLFQEEVGVKAALDEASRALAAALGGGADGGGGDAVPIG